MTEAQVSGYLISGYRNGKDDLAELIRDLELEEVQVLEKLLNVVTEYRSSHHRDNYIEFHKPEDLKQLLNLEEGEGALNWDQIFHWVGQYLKYSVATQHPRFVNRMWSVANLPSIVGEVITAITNTSAGTFESAPVSTLMEQHMIRRMLDLVGFPEGEGQMTTGSSNANMIAMMAARNISNGAIKQNGLFVQQPLFAFVSQDAHYSLDKAANILGIGSEHLIRIPVNERGQMVVEILEQRLRSTVKSGGVPFFVCATAGTTVRGAYDPIGKLVELRDRYGFWLHVDGAWGGAAVFSQPLRSTYLEGIENADSFTWDFHKMLGAALMCNVLLFKNANIFKETIDVGDTSYIYGADSQQDDLNLGTVSLQCGRRVDSLKWFLDWKYYGRSGYAERVERFHSLCEYAEQVIDQSTDLEMVVVRESFNVCFRFVVPEGISSNEFNQKLRRELHQKEIGLIGSGYVELDFCLRLLITNPLMNEREIDLFFEDVIREGTDLLRKIWTT